MRKVIVMLIAAGLLAGSSQVFAQKTDGKGGANVKPNTHLEPLKEVFGVWKASFKSPDGKNIGILIGYKPMLKGQFVGVLWQVTADDKIIEKAFGIAGWHAKAKQIRGFAFLNDGKYADVRMTPKKGGLNFDLRFSDGKRITEFTKNSFPDKDTRIQTITDMKVNGKAEPDKKFTFKRASPELLKKLKPLKGEPANEELYAALKPLTGNWTAKIKMRNGDMATENRRHEWALNKNFLAGQSQIRMDGKLLSKKMFIFGWDTKKKTVRAWYFDDKGVTTQMVYNPTKDKTVKGMGTNSKGDKIAMVLQSEFPNDNAWNFSITKIRFNGKAASDIKIVYKRAAKPKK